VSEQWGLEHDALGGYLRGPFTAPWAANKRREETSGDASCCLLSCIAYTLIAQTRHTTRIVAAAMNWNLITPNVPANCTQPALTRQTESEKSISLASGSSCRSLCSGKFHEGLMQKFQGPNAILILETWESCRFPCSGALKSD
jgi:hypothetical protein